MTTEDSIPVVDFEDVLSSTDLSSCAAVQEIHSAFTTIGFVLIKNHGIKQELIDRVNSVALEFFNKPMEVKRKSLYCHSTKDTKRNGYIALWQEGKSYNSPRNYNEAFEVCNIKECNYPDEDVPEFRSILSEYYRECIKLAHVILELIGRALKPQDPLFFVKRHMKIGEGCDLNYSAARVLHYPPVPPSFDFGKLLLSDEDQVRLRMHEHVDNGSVTLLFNDPNVQGLQVKKRSGDGWIDAVRTPGTVIVNLGITMEKWTGEKYRATPHRVIVPKDENSRLQRRLCCIVFVHPDGDTVIESIDGSNKHPPFIARDDTKSKVHEFLLPEFEKTL